VETEQAVGPVTIATKSLLVRLSGMNIHTGGLVVKRLGRKTCNQEVVGSTPGWVAMELLVPGWTTVCGQVNHLRI